MRKTTKRIVSRTVVSLLVVVLILVSVLLVDTAVAELGNTVTCQSQSGVEDETGAKLIDNDVIYIICTGADNSTDPPALNGDPTDDDWLVDTTYASCGIPFGVDTGKFDKDIITTNLNVSDIIYCRAWNNDTIATATYYGDSGTYTIAGTPDPEEHDFGTWSTDTSSPVQIGSNFITFISHTYDPATCYSTWTYNVTSGSNPSLSHWVIEWYNQSAFIDCSEDEDCEYGPDQSTGITGIKFNIGYEGGESRTVWFRLYGCGDYYERNRHVGMKSGINEDYGWVPGPIEREWDSYNDSAHNNQDDTFSNYATEHTVYMYGQGFATGTGYRIIFWDEVGGTWYNRKTDDKSSDANGNLSSQHTFSPSADTDGNWHCTVYDSQTYSPSTYDPNDAHIVSDDTSYTGGYAFYVYESAIPEFPTVIAAIAVSLLCAVAYMVMRRKAGKR